MKWPLVRKTRKNAEELSGVAGECNTLAWLKHPNIVQPPGGMTRLAIPRFYVCKIAWDAQVARSCECVQELLCVYGVCWQHLTSQAPPEQARPGSCKSGARPLLAVSAGSLLTHRSRNWTQAVAVTFLFCIAFMLGTTNPDLTCRWRGNSSMSGLISF